MKILFICFTICVSLIPGLSQRKLLKEIVENRITLNYADSSIIIFTLPLNKETSVSDEKLYYWYKANNIRTTRGGYDGKLLHGVFKQFYSNLNLHKKGSFKKGLKTGTWKTWYPNGELQEISHWKKGVKNGSQIVYNIESKPVQKVNFKNGIIKGLPVDYDKNGNKVKLKKKNKRKFWKSLFENNKTKKPTESNVKKEKSEKTGRTTIISTEPAKPNP